MFAATADRDFWKTKMEMWLPFNAPITRGRTDSMDDYSARRT